jgi:hypothetical protein
LLTYSVVRLCAFPYIGGCLSLHQPCKGICPAGRILCNKVCKLATKYQACEGKCLPISKSCNGKYWKVLYGTVFKLATRTDSFSGF